MSDKKLSPAVRHLVRATTEEAAPMMEFYDERALGILEDAEAHLQECLGPQMTKLRMIRDRIHALKKGAK